MIRTFEYHLKTGSGWTRVTLNLATQLAIMEFDSQWMGSESIRYRMYWDHTPYSRTYGVLYLRAVEHYVETDPAFTIPEDLARLLADPEGQIDDHADLPPRYTHIIYEYICLPTAEPWIADEPDLEDMKHFFGLAQWPEEFDLFVWQHVSLPLVHGRLAGTPLERVLLRIDKLKFARVAEEEDTGE